MIIQAERVLEKPLYCQCVWYGINVQNAKKTTAEQLSEWTMRLGTQFMVNFDSMRRLRPSKRFAKYVFPYCKVTFGRRGRGLYELLPGWKFAINSPP